MNTFKKLAIPSLLFVSAAMSPLAMAHGSFDGHDVNVKFEMWQVDAEKNITEVLVVRNELDVTAADGVMPDAEDFHAMDDKFNLWDIDFHEREVELTFTSIYVQDNDNQYMYMSPVGFHFEDAEEGLSDILHVTVDDRFAPSAFNKDLLSFDANNINISLQGSMCHIAGMGGMPECTNEESPTNYSNIITAKVLFADNADDLFTWAEGKYSDLFSTQEESFYLLGYYVREYSGYYLGTKGGDVYLYNKASEELTELGSIEPFLEMMHEDHMHEGAPMTSEDCGENQHFMADTEVCMDNGAMM
ncbi:MAG: hypothetical protein KAJ63_13885 [Methyloprofundus sp.]|nr:hypothetical protein [Methyloprofundus sp.]